MSMEEKPSCRSGSVGRGGGMEGWMSLRVMEDNEGKWEDVGYRGRE